MFTFFSTELSLHISEYPVDGIISLKVYLGRDSGPASCDRHSSVALLAHTPNTQPLCRGAFLCGKCLSILLTGKAAGLRVACKQTWSLMYLVHVTMMGH